MSAFTIHNESYTLVSCYSCGVKYLIPTILDTRALDRRERVTVHCPNGHGWSYAGESDADKFRRERDRAVQDKARLQDELAAAERSKERAVAETKRIKKRAAAALCPCCNRHFANVERHMKSKHPEIATLPVRTNA